MQTSLKPILFYFVPVAVAGILAHVVLLNPEILPLRPDTCRAPITYSVTAFDPRFGIEPMVLDEAVREAAAVWNTASGEVLLESSEHADLSINFIYDERQQALELGTSIEEEQEEYQDMKKAIDGLKERHASLTATYERASEKLDRDIEAYQEEVAGWNTRGGAPPAVYARLAIEKATLTEAQASLATQAVRIESVGRDINRRVDALNALVGTLNENAETYNETLGHDFDQGNYVDNGEGRRINIYTFENKDDLVRVLVHEFGHALGIGHVENPESIMYSYNVGSTHTLSEEDLTALRNVCGS